MLSTCDGYIINTPQSLPTYPHRVPEDIEGWINMVVRVFRNGDKADQCIHSLLAGRQMPNEGAYPCRLR